MGVMSRKVLPMCGSLCFFCPAMRARSRQPVKRYKKILADIFPQSQVVIYVTMEIFFKCFDSSLLFNASHYSNATDDAMVIQNNFLSVNWE